MGSFGSKQLASELVSNTLLKASIPTYVVQTLLLEIQRVDLPQRWSMICSFATLVCRPLFNQATTPIVKGPHLSTGID